MYILKPANYVLIKGICSSDLGQYSIRLVNAKQIETDYRVSGLELD